MLARVLRVLGLALAIGLLIRRLERGHMTREEAIAPAPVSPAPANKISPLARFVRRHALAEIATIVGIPLGLLALLFTALAARDTTRQLEFTQRQIQPVIQITTHDQEIGKDANGDPRYVTDQLAVAIEGRIRDGGASVTSAFAMLDKNNEWSVTRVEWWSEVRPRRGEIARWSTNPKLVKPLLKDRSVVNGTHLGTFIHVGYMDLAGVHHSEYFAIAETYSATHANSGSANQGTPEPSSIAKECESLVNSLELEGEIPDRPITIAHLQAGSFKFPLCGDGGMRRSTERMRIKVTIKKD
jgi:hypothetical protein